MSLAPVFRLLGELVDALLPGISHLRGPVHLRLPAFSRVWVRAIHVEMVLGDLEHLGIVGVIRIALEKVNWQREMLVA